jgi:hypothetical protein
VTANTSPPLEPADEVSRTLGKMIGVMGVVLVVILAVWWARVPESRWERARVQLDLVPLDDLAFELVLDESGESGSKWQVFFGEDSSSWKTFSILDEPFDVLEACDAVRSISEQIASESYQYQDLTSTGNPRCALSYSVFDISSESEEYIRVLWSVEASVGEVPILHLVATRPHRL